MTGRQKLIAGMICGAALIGGAAWAGDGGSTTPRGAQTAPLAAGGTEVAELLVAARLGPLMQIVATEGARHGLGLEDALFPGRGGTAWASAVSRIQSPDRLTEMLAATIAVALRDGDMTAALAFYASPLGARIAEREVASRRAMLDADVEASALDASAADTDEPSGRAALVRELIETLDLVSANVVGGLNANYAFYRGLGDGGALSKRLTERQMLAMVWSQEDEIRAVTSRWLVAHLTLAYAPLSDRELRDYIDFSSSDTGRRLSAAIFAGFGRVFEETSYELGRAAARFIAMTDA